MNVSFPYGKTYMRCDIPDDRFAGQLVFKMHHYTPELSQEGLVAQALENPVGTHKLSELSKDKQNVVIIASDHTRPVPSKIIIPQMLAQIRQGNPLADITILIATGCHRDTTRDELIGKFGQQIVDTEKIVVHNCDDADNLTYLGKLPSGGDLIINKLAAEADLLVAEGFIEPHFFAGFSGGRKSVLPGIASRSTVLYNHNADFIASEYARAGILENNPIHRDMTYAAQKAKLAFICTVIINSNKEVVYAVSGDAELAHLKGCEFLKDMCMVKAVPSDIVITSNGGYPLDQNIYQAVKGMSAAEATVKDNGVIIMLAQSGDGHGGEVFYGTFCDQKNLDKMMSDFLMTPRDVTIVDQWQSQIFARVLIHANVIYISDAPDEVVENLHMIPAHNLETAIEIADQILEKRGIVNGSILAVPDGVAVMVDR